MNIQLGNVTVYQIDPSSKTIRLSIQLECSELELPLPETKTTVLNTVRMASKYLKTEGFIDGVKWNLEVKALSKKH